MQDTICRLHGYIMHPKKTADHSKTPIISGAQSSQLKNTGNNFRLAAQVFHRHRKYQNTEVISLGDGPGSAVVYPGDGTPGRPTLIQWLRLVSNLG